jgi:uncharacterized membrane protein YbhN (UPF0104 family)
VTAPPAEATRGRSPWSWILSALISGVTLYFAVRGVEWARFWQTIAAAHWSYVAGTAALQVSSYFLRGVRWRILLNAEGRFSIGTVFWANMAGYLGNNFLPARAGEVLRSVLISSRSSLSKTYVLTTAISERLMDVIALVLFGSVALLGIDPKPRWMADLSRTMALGAAAGAIAITVLPHTGLLLESIIERFPLPARFRPSLLRLAAQVLLGLRAFHDWGRFAGFVFLTVVIWTIDACATVVGGKALGIEISFRIALVLLTGLGLGSALPSTPGYVGIFQFVAVTVLVPFGIPKDKALAFILVIQATGYVVVLALGLPGLYKARRAKAGT